MEIRDIRYLSAVRRKVQSIQTSKHIPRGDDLITVLDYVSFAEPDWSGDWVNFAATLDLASELFASSESMEQEVQRALVGLLGLIERKESEIRPMLEATVTSTAEAIEGSWPGVWLQCPDCGEVSEANLSDAMWVCPRCENTFRNPRFGSFGNPSQSP